MTPITQGVNTRSAQNMMAGYAVGGRPQARMLGLETDQPKPLGGAPPPNPMIGRKNTEPVTAQPLMQLLADRMAALHQAGGPVRF